MHFDRCIPESFVKLQNSYYSEHFWVGVNASEYNGAN